MERLYLPVEGEQLTRQAKTVLFLCQYCGWDLFEVSLVQILSQGEAKGNEKHQQETTLSERKLSKADKLPKCCMKENGGDRSAGQTDGGVGTSTCRVFKAVDEPSVGKLSAEKLSVGDRPVAESPLEGLTVWDNSLGEPSVEKPLEESPIGKIGEPLLVEPFFIGEPSFVEPSLREYLVREPLVKKPSIGEPSAGEPFLGEPSVGEPSVESSIRVPPSEEPHIAEISGRRPLLKVNSVGDPSLGDPSLGDPSLGDPSLGDPSLGELSVEETFNVQSPVAKHSIKNQVCNNVEPYEVNSNQNGSHQARSFTDRLAKIILQPWDGLPVHITVKDLRDVDWLVQQCCLPAIVGSEGQMCYAGLCAVLRRIVKKAHERYPQRNFGALLGHKQACLKKCSEVSPWTKLCEIDIYQILKVNGAIPGAILEIEKRLESPLTISSKVLGKKNKKDSKTLNMSDETVSQSTQEFVMPESVFQTDALHMTDKRKIKTAKSVYKKQANIKTKCERKLEQAHLAAVAKSRSDCIDCQDKVESPLSEDTRKRSSSFKDLSTSKFTTNDQSELTETNISSVQSDGRTKVTQANVQVEAEITKNQHSEQCHLEHLFLEGPHVTLADFALFLSLHSYQQKCMEAGRGHDLFRDIPLVCRWYQRMWTVPNVRDCANRCGLEEVLISKEFIEESCTANKTRDRKVLDQEADKSKAKQDRMNKMIKISQLPSVKNRVSDILSRLQAGGVDVTVDDLPTKNTQLPWDEFPEEISPSQDVSVERAMNKRHQIESLVAAVKMIAKRGDIIVDFCSGGGHVGIVLAHCLPDCRILLIENNEESVKRAEDRIQGTGLGNIIVYQCNLNYYTGTFDIGVSLHACGVATDLVLAKCLQSRASFVCSPCCYGSVRDSQLITYPRSQFLRDLPLAYEEYLFLGHIAEQTSRDFDSEMAKQAKICMSVLDTDRAQAAREDGYWVKLYSLSPLTCSPKNNLLIGRPASNDKNMLRRPIQDGDVGCAHLPTT